MKRKTFEMIPVDLSLPIPLDQEEASIEAMSARKMDDFMAGLSCCFTGFGTPLLFGVTFAPCFLSHVLLFCSSLPQMVWAGWAHITRCKSGYEVGLPLAGATWSFFG